MGYVFLLIVLPPDDSSHLFFLYCLINLNKYKYYVEKNWKEWSKLYDVYSSWMSIFVQPIMIRKRLLVNLIYCCAWSCLCLIYFIVKLHLACFCLKLDATQQIMISSFIPSFPILCTNTDWESIDIRVSLIFLLRQDSVIKDETSSDRHSKGFSLKVISSWKFIYFYMSPVIWLGGTQ